MASPKRSKKPTHRTQRPELSAREVRFCRLYVELGNATEAAEQAGFAANNRVTLASVGYKLLRKVQIRQLIRRMQQEAADAAQLSVNRHAQHLARKAYGDRTAIFDAKGRVRPPARWPAELRAIIAGLEVEEQTEAVTDPATGKTRTVTTVTYKVRFERGSEADKLIAQHLGMIGVSDASSADGTGSRVVITTEKGEEAAGG